MNLQQPEVQEYRRHLSRWVDERLVPQAARLDELNDFNVELFREIGALGYLGTMYPEEVGGSGAPFPYTTFSVLCEELARGSMGFAAGVCMQGSTATHTLHAWGGDEVKQRWLRPALAGEKVGAFAITEPDAGSDAASLRTRARRGDGGWVLTGRKIFTTNGTVADFITVVATVDPSRAAKGLELFVVDTASRGFGIGRKLDKVSVRCSDTAELTFDEVFVPDSHCLGDGAGGGFLRAYQSLTVDRIFTAALALGNAQAAYDGAVRYAKERRQFGQPIGQFQAVQFRLVDMFARLERAKLLTYHAAALADRGEPITTEAALAKIVAAEDCHGVCELALSVFGGYGLMNEFPAQRYLRDSYFPMIGGGTGDIMRLVVARQLGL